MSKIVVIGGVFIALIVGLVVWADAATPNSTQGVHIVGKNKARLPEGEVFVLSHHVGKVRKVWEITFDGDSSVRFHCETWLCGDLDTAHLNGTNNIVDIGAGWGDHFYVWLRPDGAVNIKWPWGWHYRGYKA